MPILKLRETASDELRFLADYVYEKVFQGYTLKQWGCKPEELGAGVTAGAYLSEYVMIVIFRTFIRGCPS
ncbi:MAG: hypothetical protein R3E08_09415 [Thiotrichaceae bacterium]